MILTKQTGQAGRLMQSGSSNRPTYEQLEQELSRMDEAIQNCERLSVVNQYAAAVMHEVNNPLEAITNLIYLIKQEQVSPAAQQHLQSIDEQLVMLGNITRSTLSFYRSQSNTAEVDLVTIAESALRLHALHLAQKRVEVRTRFSGRTAVECPA